MNRNVLSEIVGIAWFLISVIGGVQIIVWLIEKYPRIAGPWYPLLLLIWVMVVYVGDRLLKKALFVLFEHSD